MLAFVVNQDQTHEDVRVDATHRTELFFSTRPDPLVLFRRPVQQSLVHLLHRYDRASRAAKHTVELIQGSSLRQKSHSPLEIEDELDAITRSQVQLLSNFIRQSDCAVGGKGGSDCRHNN